MSNTSVLFTKISYGERSGWEGDMVGMRDRKGEKRERSALEEDIKKERTLRRLAEGVDCQKRSNRGSMGETE